MKRFDVAFLIVALCVSSASIATAGQRRDGQSRDAAGGRATADARSRGPSPSVESRTTPEQPSINRPSFPIDGLNRPSFPIHGPLGTGPDRPSPFAATSRTYSRSLRSQAYGLPPGYGIGFAPYANTATIPGSRAARGDEAGGAVFVDATPRTALVFIDSAYVGAVDDLPFTGVTLAAGRHWLELEAPDYERDLIEINVTPDRPLRYRAELKPVTRAALAVTPPRLPETIYVIPGCYGGNRPPTAAILPAGCEIANVRVITPQRTQ